MILDLIQVSKELFSANFNVMRKNEQIGCFSLQGNIGTMEAKISGRLFENKFELNIGKTDDIDTRYAFRPYIINKNDIYDGTVYQTKYKGRLFHSFEYHQIKKSGITYDLFPVGLGKEGSKSPIYHHNTQIAQIDKESTVHNDLHIFKIFAKDELSGEVAVLAAMYMYINACYKPGKKVVSSTVKVYSKTTNKLLLEKYNPEFVKDVTE